MRLLLAALLAFAPGPGAAATFTDDLGRRVEIPDRPLRVVSLAPHLTELMFAAGAGDRLAGVVAFSDFPPAASELPVVGDAFSLDHERIARIRPDLILAWVGGNPTRVIQRLAQDGYAVIALEAADLDRIGDQIERLGRLMGTRAAAVAAAGAYRSRLAALTVHRDGAPITAFVQIAQEPLYTIGGRHLISDVLRRCGAVNVFDDLDAPAAQVSYEVVLERAPEMIIASVPGPSDGWRDLWRRWPRLPAVRDDRLIAVPADLLSRPTPRILLGMARICAATDRG
jgi:iron complex transport system substrate-binding protein